MMTFLNFKKIFFYQLKMRKTFRQGYDQNLTQAVFDGHYLQAIDMVNRGIKWDSGADIFFDYFYNTRPNVPQDFAIFVKLMLDIWSTNPELTNDAPFIIFHQPEINTTYLEFDDYSEFMKNYETIFFMYKFFHTDEYKNVQYRFNIENLNTVNNMNRVTIAIPGENRMVQADINYNSTRLLINNFYELNDDLRIMLNQELIYEIKIAHTDYDTYKVTIYFVNSPYYEQYFIGDKILPILASLNGVNYDLFDPTD